jgi:poly(3-hydroxybutyrate) depolymerase
LHVFKINGPLDPASCQGQRPLTHHQLHGVPDPTNPQ